MLGVGECFSVAPMLSVITYVQVEGMGIILGLLASQFTNQVALMQSKRMCSLRRSQMREKELAGLHLLKLRNKYFTADT